MPQKLWFFSFFFMKSTFSLLTSRLQKIFTKNYKGLIESD